MPFSRFLVLLAALLCALAGCARTPEPQVHEAPAATPVAEVRGAPAPSLEASTPPAPDLLRAWDAARSRAWARGDPHRLARLYAPGSTAGARDLAMLRAWSARGLRVRGLQTQLLSVREVARTRTTWTLWVTDRLVGGVVTGPGTRRPLPRDGPSTRTVRLRLVGATWRVAAVRPGEVAAVARSG